MWTNDHDSRDTVTADNGSPSLFAYRRAVVTVSPAGG
jgi:hypothetical protein